MNRADFPSLHKRSPNPMATFSFVDSIAICRQHRNFRHFQQSNFPDWKRHGFPAFWEKVLFKRN
jgi:hypothetical protein